jgi:aminopeptidase N
MNMTSSISLSAACTLALSLCGIAWAQPAVSSPPSDEDVATSTPARDPALGVESGDPRIDPATGRLVATWRKDRWFDFQHITVELDIPDINVAVATGIVTIVASPLAYAVSDMELDATGPLPTAATVNGEATRVSVRSTDRGNKVLVQFPSAISVGQRVEVAIKYTLDYSEAKGEGLTWCKGDPDSPSPTAQKPMIHAQGQAELNSRWFPCFDSPTDRLTSEMIVTVDDGFQVVSNGALIGRAAASPGSVGQARTRWHWRQNQPHVPYLITVGIGAWSVVDVRGESSLPMPVYALAGQEDVAREVFANTPDMIRFFEERFQEPYPWDQYAQVLVRCFIAGGMENTSATFLRAGAARGERGGKDDLISHELAHQWFGDLITCKSWDHLWLNEGWATYAESLWNEEKARRAGGEEAAREAYLAEMGGMMRGMARRVLRRGGVASPEHPALVSNRFFNPDATFEKRDNPYGKGALMLHMLREELGSEVFFRGVALYVDRYKFRQVETDDFRHVLEEVSGKSLERFFEQWASRPGIPVLEVSTRWDSGALSVSVKQTQRVDRLNPAYAFALPLLATLENGERVALRVMVNSTTTEAQFNLPGTPTQLTIDPSYTVLAAITQRTVDPRTGAAIEEPEAQSPAAPTAEPSGVTPAAGGQ